MKEGNRVSNNSMKKKKNIDGSNAPSTEGILRGFQLLGEGNCKMKSQSGENHSVLKTVNPGWVLESWNCRKEGKEQLKLVKLFGAHRPN